MRRSERIPRAAAVCTGANEESSSYAYAADRGFAITGLSLDPVVAG